VTSNKKKKSNQEEPALSVKGGRTWETSNKKKQPRGGISIECEGRQDMGDIKQKKKATKRRNQH
jgi:hypothetical protein